MVDTEISIYKESDFIFIKKDNAYIKFGKSRYRKIIDFEIYERIHQRIIYSLRRMTISLKA